MAAIKSIFSQEKIDKQGTAYLETLVETNSGLLGKSIVYLPEQAKPLALTLNTDSDPFRYRGKGLSKAAESINKFFGPLLLNHDFASQKDLDLNLEKVDNQPDTSLNGANTTWAISLAYYLACHSQNKAKATHSVSLVFSFLNGGDLGGGNNLSWREIGIYFPNQSLVKQLQLAGNVFTEMGFLLDQRSYVRAAGDLGGYAPDLLNSSDCFSLCLESLTRSGLKPGADSFLSINAGADQFFYRGRYQLFDVEKPITDETLCSQYLRYFDSYPVGFIVDPFASDEWYSWSNIQHRTTHCVMASDAVASRAERLQTGYLKKAFSAVAIEPVSCGTVTQIQSMVSLSKSESAKTAIVLGRQPMAYETLIDFAINLQVDFITVPSPVFLKPWLSKIF